ncbi:MAG: hypothetical protein WBK77_05640 [Alphaproteobacteria bacterium]
MTKRSLIAGLTIASISAVVIVGTFGIPDLWNNKSGEKSPVELSGRLEGFSPGAKVRYSILPEKGLTASGEVEVTEKGNIGIPAYNLYNGAGRFLAYDIEVSEEKKSAPVHMTFVLDSEKGKISLQGKGLKEFSEIGIGTTKTRADWAGIIKASDMENLDDLDEGEGIKVALYSNDIMNDATRVHPKIIKILAAPGGGQFSDGALNTYSFPYGCNDGVIPGPDFSFCDTAAMDAQIRNIVNNYVTALILMSHQLAAVMGSIPFPVGQMIDAKQQLEVQRNFEKLRAEAHKDYHPSELMCEFGTFVKSLSTANNKAEFEKMAINDIMIGHYSDLQHTESSEGLDSDSNSRLKHFREVYCDPSDNNDGLHYICRHNPANATPEGAANDERINKDLLYSKTVGNPLTLDIDFAYSHTNGTTRAPTADEEDVIALAKNLYWPRPFQPGQEEQLSKDFSKYQTMRHILATMGVAHNSYASIVGMKGKTEQGLGAQSGWNYMKALMRDFGLSDANINELLGEYPSYYAQMEVLTKKAYQHPDFYTNLYDKPANVKRISATLEAINIMQQRDVFESSLRREMLTSLMVEEALRKRAEDMSGSATSDSGDMQRR